jgi:nucleotide-binding universal stress UspA family protein
VTPQVFVSGVTPLIQQLDVQNAQKLVHECCARIARLRLTKHDEVVLLEPATETIAAMTEQKGVDLAVVGSSGGAASESSSLARSPKRQFVTYTVAFWSYDPIAWFAMGRWNQS